MSSAAIGSTVGGAAPTCAAAPASRATAGGGDAGGQAARVRGASFSAHLRGQTERASSPNAKPLGRPGESAQPPLARGATSLVAGDGEGVPLDTAKMRSRAPKSDDDERTPNDGPGVGAGRAGVGLEELDPMARHLRSPLTHGGAVCGPASAMPQPPDPARETARVSLDQLMSRFVRRVAWSGDGHAGSATLELGAGELEGAVLTLHARGGEVQVSLDLPPGVDSAAWRERIGQRLSARGLHVSSLEVT